MSYRPVRSGQLVPAVALSLFTAAATAGAARSPTDMDAVVVTATRTAQTQDQTLAAVTVIDRAEIERRQPVSLLQLLDDTPGMATSSNGGAGKVASLFLRGTDADQMLVLVDGVKLGSATTGTAAIQDIPLDQIERIEIVRGPFSSLYGSEAIGGVIQIFTRRADGPFTPNASLSLGGYASLRGGAGFAGKHGRGWYSVQASHAQTHGINACRVGAAEAFAGCFADQPDKDGYRNNALTLQGGYRFNSAWTGDVRVFRAEGHNDYDGGTVDADDYASQVLGARLHYAASERLHFSLSAGGSGDFSRNFLQGRYVNRYDTHRLIGSVQADANIGTGLLSVGYDWQHDQLDSNAGFARDGRRNGGVFAQWQQGFGAQSLQASVRRDDNSQFGGKTTGSVLWGWDFARTLRLTASVGTAFRAPTFNELYFPGYGNPALRPESARNVELGLRGTPGWGHWSLSAYRNTIDHMIAFDAASFGPANVDRARITGLEGVLDTRLAGWSLRATGTVLNARNASGGAYDGNRLPRRPHASARIDADHRFGAVSVGASWKIDGRRYDDLGNRHPLGAYTLVDLRIGYAFHPDWQLQLALNNAFDKRYETAWYFNQPGRNVMLTLRYRPAHD